MEINDSLKEDLTAHLDLLLQIKTIEYQLKELNDKLKFSKKSFYDQLNEMNITDIENIIGKKIIENELLIVYKGRTFLLENIDKDNVPRSIRCMNTVIL